MSTHFSGSFTLDPPITPPHFAYLRAFSRSRRVRRDPTRLGPDPVRGYVDLPAGEEGGYYVGDRKNASVIDSDHPPKGQPYVWCPWTVGDDGILQWDEREKARFFVEWIEYIALHFLKRWGYRLSGTVRFIVEEEAGVIFATDDGIVVKTIDDLTL